MRVWGAGSPHTRARPLVRGAAIRPKRRWFRTRLDQFGWLTRCAGPGAQPHPGEGWAGRRRGGYPRAWTLLLTPRF